MNAPEWLDHGIHVYPLHPTTVECSKTWNQLTWPLSVPPEARKDDLGLLERTVLPEGVCQPQGMDHGSTRWVVSSCFEKYLSSLGIFPLGVHQKYSILLLWKTEQHRKWGRGGCRVLPNVVTTTYSYLSDCLFKNSCVKWNESHAKKVWPPPQNPGAYQFRNIGTTSFGRINQPYREAVGCIVPVVTLWEPSKSSVTSLPKSPQKSLVCWSSGGTTNNFKETILNRVAFLWLIWCT